MKKLYKEAITQQKNTFISTKVILFLWAKLK